MEVAEVLKTSAPFDIRHIMLPMQINMVVEEGIRERRIEANPELFESRSNVSPSSTAQIFLSRM